jgi:hypothetical protein
MDPVIALASVIVVPPDLPWRPFFYFRLRKSEPAFEPGCCPQLCCATVLQRGDLPLPELRFSATFPALASSAGFA